MARQGRLTRRHNPPDTLVVAAHRLPVRRETVSSRLETLKVSATSKPGAVAGAIAGVVRSQHKVEVQASGPGAINQAIKAIAISRAMWRPADSTSCASPPSSPYRSTGRSGYGHPPRRRSALVACPQRRNKFSAIDALEHSIALVPLIARWGAPPGSHPTTPRRLLEQVDQSLAARWLAQLTKRPALDLTNALAGDPESFAVLVRHLPRLTVRRAQLCSSRTRS